MPSCPFCHKDVPPQSTVCPHCLRAQPVTIPTSQRAASAGREAMHGRWRLLFLVLLLAGVSAFGYKRYRALPANAYSPYEPLAPAAEPAPQAVQTTIAPPLDVAVADTASVTVAGGRYLAFPFSGVSRTGCHVTGRVRVLSGGDRRVSVVVVDRDGLAELEAGRTAQTWYDSGPVSDAALDFKVDGRTAYSLVVLNTAPRARTKSVRLTKIVAACAD